VCVWLTTKRNRHVRVRDADDCSVLSPAPSALPRLCKECWRNRLTVRLYQPISQHTAYCVCIHGCAGNSRGCPREQTLSQESSSLELGVLRYLPLSVVVHLSLVLCNNLRWGITLNHKSNAGKRRLLNPILHQPLHETETRPRRRRMFHFFKLSRNSQDVFEAFKFSN